jgi:hypothetical protein
MNSFAKGGLKVLQRIEGTLFENLNQEGLENTFFG